MKLLIFLFLLLVFIVGCGKSHTFYVSGEHGKNSLMDISRGSMGDCDEGVIINSGLDDNRDGILNSDEISSTSFVCDGTNGSDGVDGSSSVVSVLDPCGDEPGHHDELVMVLDDGTYLAWLKNVGIVELLEGVLYRTTDHQRCRFIIDNDELVD